MEYAPVALLDCEHRTPGARGGQAIGLLRRRGGAGGRGASRRAAAALDAHHALCSMHASVPEAPMQWFYCDTAQPQRSFLFHACCPPLPLLHPRLLPHPRLLLTSPPHRRRKHRGRKHRGRKHRGSFPPSRHGAATCHHWRPACSVRRKIHDQRAPPDNRRRRRSRWLQAAAAAAARCNCAAICTMRRRRPRRRLRWSQRLLLQRGQPGNRRTTAREGKERLETEWTWFKTQKQSACFICSPTCSTKTLLKSPQTTIAAAPPSAPTVQPNASSLRCCAG